MSLRSARALATSVTSGESGPSAATQPRSWSAAWLTLSSASAAPFAVATAPLGSMTTIAIGSAAMRSAGGGVGRFGLRPAPQRKDAHAASRTGAASSGA